MKNRALSVLVILLPLAMIHAQNSAPEAQPIVDAVVPARDIPWPGVIRLSVDASDNTRGIFRVTETIPISTTGPLTLLYPKWLPGEHSNNGPISQLAGLELKAGGKSLPWRRDPVDVFAFHLNVPEGTSQIEAEFQYLAPTDANQGRVMTTPEMLNLEWNSVVLYPAGYYVRQINVDASVKLPSDWKEASALEVASRDGGTVHFKPVGLDTLVDSPIFAGANMRVETLSPDVHLNVFADDPEQLAASDEQVQYHRNLVAQAVKLFGAQHYNHYDFLLEISGREGGIGLEHHRSSENGVQEGYFTKWDDNVSARTLLPHEYTHSWNGKFRRPADLWTPDYRTPMQDSLLWVYEGQTQFWGIVLAARSGLISKQQALDTLAALAARLDTMAGRKWRPLSDTTDDPIVSQRRPKGWISWQRQEDYYNEGALIWLDADSLIRQLSGGARSMDDFARAFFGVHDRDWGEMIYTFDDVVKTLNQVQPHDWAAFLHARLDNINEHAPLDGFTRGGYQLVYTNAPTETFKTGEKARKVTDLSYSVGFILDKDSTITEVGWDTPAFNASLTVGSKLVALNGRSFEPDQLKADLKAKKSPLNFLVKTGDFFRTVELKYDGGLRYPSLEKTTSGSSSLDALLTAKP